MAGSECGEISVSHRGCDECECAYVGVCKKKKKLGGGGRNLGWCISGGSLGLVASGGCLVNIGYVLSPAAGAGEGLSEGTEVVSTGSRGRGHSITDPRVGVGVLIDSGWSFCCGASGRTSGLGSPPSLFN